MLGLLAMPVILYTDAHLGLRGHGLGILGGGYGAAQMAITGSTFLPDGWQGVNLLLLLCGAEMDLYFRAIENVVGHIRDYDVAIAQTG